MTKVLPWNSRGVDARESAREAARREGKSIGEWLHGVIADHAADLGVAERDVASQARVDAIATKLRAIGASARAEEGDDVRDPAPVALTPGRKVQPQAALDDTRYDARRDRPGNDDEDLLEEAFQAMERRAVRSERRTKDALSSFAKMLESNEQKRERERQSIVELTRKLSTIESTLIDRAKAVENPIKGSLARLEARLEMIGRRGAAEASTRLDQIEPEERATSPDPLRPLEDASNPTLELFSSSTRPAPAPGPVAAATNDRASRVGTALAAPVAPRASAGQPVSPEAARRPPPSPRRFDNAVSEIAKRQQSLEDQPASGDPMPSVPVDAAGKPGGAPQAAVRRPLPAPYEAMQNEMTGLAKAVEEMRRELPRGRATPERHASDLDSLRAEITAMSQSFHAYTQQGSIAALEERIAAVADRIEASRDSGIRETVLRPIETMIGDLRRAMRDLDQREPLGKLDTQVQAIAGKIGGLEDAGVFASAAFENIQQEVGALRRAVVTLDPRQGVSELEGGIRAIAAKLEHLERGGIAAAALASIQEQVDELRILVAATAKRHVAVEQIEHRFTSLVEKVERHATAKPDVGQLEGLVRELGRKIEAVQAPGAHVGAIEALEQQIGLLAARFEKAESGLPVLSTIERSMRELLAHLEETRAGVETSAAHAAREVLRLAAERNPAKGEEARKPDPSFLRDIASLKALQDEADARTSSTLNAVHETLERVVDRLSSMETDLDDVRARNTRPVIETRPARAPIMARSSDERRSALQISLGAPDPRTDATFDRTAHPAKTRRIDGRGKPTDLDDEAGRADFIAAARRAAQAAQTDPSVQAMARPALSPAPATRAGLLARSRDYVASHKKPVLLGFAALFVIIGTVTIMHRLGLSSEEMSAERAPAAKLAASTAPATPAGTAASGSPSADASGSLDKAALSPSAMPKSAPLLAGQIAGSDPIQTGSIPDLPAFASRGGDVVSRALLPSGLQAAAEAGDGAAQYELGASYAAGRAAPHDMKLAAKWYDKAAAQGIVPAQYRLASLYEKGIGVAQDKSRAKNLYQRAADAGNPRAMHNLAVMLADGDGKPDYDGAAIWFRKAAQYGIHDSQFNLAILLARGLGVSQSLVQSYQWFAIAADQNDSDAAKKRDEVGLKLGANDIAVAKALAAAFHPRIANPSAIEVKPQADGWDGVAPASHLNSTKAKISSL